MKVAIVGTSHIHVPAFYEVCRDDPRIDLVGFAEPDSTSPFVPPSDIPIFDSLANLPDHDVAVVATDIASHERAIQELATKSIFIEKPLGVNARQAKRLAELLEVRQVNAQIGLFLRRDPALSRLRDLVRSGQMGHICSASFSFAHAGFSEGWLKDWPAHLSAERQGYGTFGDLAVHLVDYGQSLFGALTPRACHVTVDDQIGTDHQGHAILTASSGTVIQIWTSAISDRTILEMQIVGSRGVAVFREGMLTISTEDGPSLGPTPVTASPKEGFQSAMHEYLGEPVLPGATMFEAVQANAVLDKLHAIVLAG